MFEIKNEADLNTALENTVAVIDFWAPWCGPCKALAPVFEELANKNPYPFYAKANCDEVRDLALKYGVRSVPTVLIIIRGEVKATLVGLNSEQVYLDAITSALLKDAESTPTSV